MQDDDPEVVRVEEDPPQTQRAVPLPRNFKALSGRNPSFVEIAATLSTLQSQVAGMALNQTRQGLQLDLFVKHLGEKFDKLEKTVLTNDGRLDTVEKSLAQKAVAVAAPAARGTFWLIAGSVLTQLLPQYAELIRSIVHP